ncbi:MAG: trypsin-like serine protease [Acidimicrobiia bacterium]|nr:trypsin-like serine protease [Acidimicrobiia bacterium]
MRRLITLAFALGLMLSLAAPAGAITNGSPDSGEHPYVGELLFYVPDAIDDRFNDPGGWFTCTGTLIEEMIVLTAGHCTFAIGLNGASTTEGDGDGNGGNDVWINFEEVPDFEILDPSSSFGPDGNAARYAQWSAALNGSSEWHQGTATSHTDYSDPAFFLADAGILELASDPGIDEWATLAPLDHLDQYSTRRDPTKRFTAVGYGLETGFPTFLGGDTRMQAEMKLVSLRGAYGAGKGISAAFSSNASQGKGGTCFGDSGGPLFDGDLLVAVTSFGISFNCVEPGGFYRIDQEDDASFIGGFIG